MLFSVKILQENEESFPSSQKDDLISASIRLQNIYSSLGDDDQAVDIRSHRKAD